VINDLAATALAIPFLHSRELHSIVNGRAVAGGAKILIAPGTGLGTAILSLLDGKYLFISSEGGHMDFAPNNDVQVRLWQYLRTRYGHVSVERVVSGSGLMNIYGFLRDSEGMAEPKWLTRRMKDTDPAAAITEGALKRKTPICVRAVDMFVSALGAVSGNMALAGLALGGVYLGGGIPPKILQRLKQEDFKKAYLEKGRFKRLLRGIPVRVILDDRAPLLGAASAALDE
jgi:glucokinase